VATPGAWRQVSRGRLLPWTERESEREGRAAAGHRGVYAGTGGLMAPGIRKPPERGNFPVLTGSKCIGGQVGHRAGRLAPVFLTAAAETGI
jgi:hypothetical protein